MLSTTLPTLILIPTLLLLTLPLVPFAILTTSLALSALAIRAVLAYLELGTALLKQVLSPSFSRPFSRNSTSSSSSISAATTYTLKSQPRYSFSSLGSLTPQRASRSRTASISVAATQGTKPASIAGSSIITGASAGTNAERDFEGVGGWRDAGEDRDEDAEWTAMNSRLELPIAGGRMGSMTSLSSSLQLQREGTNSSSDGRRPGTGSSNHRRSWTSGAVRLNSHRDGLSRVQAARSESGEFGTWARISIEGAPGSRPVSNGRGSGTMSPDEGLTMSMGGVGGGGAGRPRSRAEVRVGMNVGRSRSKNGSSGSSSGGERELYPTMTERS